MYVVAMTISKAAATLFNTQLALEWSDTASGGIKPERAGAKALVKNAFALVDALPLHECNGKNGWIRDEFHVFKMR